MLHQSKLRATRSKPQVSTPYTPLPILNPQRPGSGLYCSIKRPNGNLEIPLKLDVIKLFSDCDEIGNLWSNESIPESDSTPHINMGAQFQCSIPARCHTTNKTSPEDLLWDPGITKCTDAEGKYTRTHTY